MSTARHHNEWLSLVPVSGPFLSMPVLMRVFPDHLYGHESEHFQKLRLAYEEWRERKNDSATHKAWIKFVLGNTLELPDEVIDEGQAVMLQATIPVHGEALRPDYIIKNPAGVEHAGKPRLLVCTYPASQNLERPVAGRHWKASPDTRMMELLHRTNCRIGLVTNGEHWMLVDAPSGETTGYISWYSYLWLDDNITLRAFRSLLGVSRFFSVKDEDTLEAMLVESAANQQEVTDQLGYQVRNAVEVLVQSLDRADQDRGGKLLNDISEEELYEAALTVMMRLVFLFSAEERELLPLDDPLYNQNYAVSTLRAALRETADQQTEDVLERRRDAWCRLLSNFRSVYGGIQHERLTLPAYGGHLLDPDRFPFLEGRASGTKWRDTPATPLPVNNRTVLHLLEALQVLQVKVPGGGHAEARLLSFRALGIENIGHVYEGLLDHTAKRATETVLGFAGGKDKEPEIPLSKLEELRANGDKELIDFLKKETGRTAHPIKKTLAEPCAIEHANRCKVACGNDELWKRVHPFASLIRTDTFGRPVIIREGSVFVTAGTDRRSSGTHYTPTSLTEPIVKHTLDPLCYVGPAEGKPESDWKLRTARELLDLKICDMACGSGAFLVQTCRYLSEMLVEAWEQAERELPGKVRITPYGEPSEGAPSDQPIPIDSEERLVYARRVIAARCLYGVDVNPLAVEMAKLSLWLLTLAKDKPFEFLDHAFRCGDSLVGLHDLDQLRHFGLKPDADDAVLFKGPLDDAVDEAINLRLRLEDMPANTVEEVEEQDRLLKQAEEQTQRLRIAANVLVGAEFVPFELLELSDDDVEADERGPAWLKAQKSQKRLRELARKQAVLELEAHFDTDACALSGVAATWLQGQKTFHWPLEFPEVIVKRGGFDAFVGNPPFIGGQRLSGEFGVHYREHLVTSLADSRRGSADLCAYFFLRVAQVSRQNGHIGLLATNTICQGDTREVGLDQLVGWGFSIPRAVKSRVWPGSASLEVAHVWSRNGEWNGQYVLDDKVVSAISSHLTPPGFVDGTPYRLASNSGKSFQGAIVLGMGFLLTPEEANELIEEDNRNADVLFPYLNGKDLNSHPEQNPSRWAINFFDWPLEKAMEYPDCFQIVEERVKPERMKLKDNVDGKRRKKFWWQYGRVQREIVEAMKGQDFVMASTRVTKFFSVSLVPTCYVHSVDLAVHCGIKKRLFTVLSSSVFDAWAREYSSTLETRLRFSISDGFETYPFPLSSEVEDFSDRYMSLRSTIMSEREKGLTATYNRFHDPDKIDADIQKLRGLHVEMDQAVAAAYGWDDLDLDHRFHETKQGIRYTISEDARREVLQRLLKLNHERYEEEVKQGLHDKKKPKSKRKRKQPTGTPLFE